MNQEKWDATNIPPQQGRKVIVTGSSSGIGFETAKALAAKKAEVILAVRNPQKGELALAKIKKEIPHAKVSQIQVDLADFSSIKAFADAYTKQFTTLDLLINNAGVMVPPYSKTKDGFELQMGTNHLGHFLLTGLLLPLLMKSKGARIVTVSSSAHHLGNINFDDLNWERRSYSPWRAYGDSKIANLYFTYELQERLRNAGSAVLATAAHPGWSDTELQRHASVTEKLNKYFAQNPEMGALPTLRAAIDESAEGGEFYGPSGWLELKGFPKVTKSNTRSHNTDIRKKLWKVSEELTTVRFSI
jgi:NAD(P)-dependent dehydrogenase (short-subunit alcohol dehydrogenase family)